MKATVLQKKDRTFTVSILATVAQQFRSELRGEGIKAAETVSVAEGKLASVAFTGAQRR